MATSSRSTQPHTVLPSTSTHPTPPSVLSQQVVSSSESATLIDVRIGLHLLGREGRTLLAQYVKAKSQQQTLHNKV